MIVRRFIHWLQNAPAGERAEAATALARAYLHSGLSDSDRAAAEGAMIMLLDDPSPLVRRALAETLAASAHAPPAVIHSLAGDQTDVAALVLERSPLFLDADLVEAVAAGGRERQVAVAGRAYLPCSVSAAIAEVGCAEACLILLENPNAEVVQLSLDRIVERHGHLAAIRDVLFLRDDLPAPTRQALVVKLSRTLADYVTARHWLSKDCARRIAEEACESATVALAADTPQNEVRALIRHLCDSGQLTAGLLLRALLSGNVVLFEEALAELADLPLSRAAAIVHDRRGVGFRALYEKAGLPAATFAAFAEALEAMHEDGFIGDPGGVSRLRRRVIERVLTRCEHEGIEEIEPLLTLLHRYAAEAAREEARLFCNELAADDWIEPDTDMHAIAA
jgi:uncharacterized protein (DUF2336 family)